MNKPRMLCWFSCGAASAVAAKESLRLYHDTHEVVIINCDTRPSEHADNYRFFEDCQKWFRQKIVTIRNTKYATVDEVFERERYMSGIAGARCTTELKKLPRHAFARPDDIHVFGFTSDERKRVQSFQERNPELLLRFTLADLGITKRDCYECLAQANIPLPAMYLLGFNNNNCPGCVKATSRHYWDMVRTLFPDVFKRRCEQSRAIGCRLTRHKGVRIFLDELPPGPFKTPRKKENLSCGPECGGPIT
ncbi:MAG: hypothetical protein KKH61_21140 [Gammaproteobacteria bacterium]|nr:hypothetical protein [Gammaproteobacteria bacterium]